MSSTMLAAKSPKTNAGSCQWNMAVPNSTTTSKQDTSMLRPLLVTAR